jgi:hypothetical protein
VGVKHVVNAPPFFTSLPGFTPVALEHCLCGSARQNGPLPHFAERIPHHSCETVEVFHLASSETQNKNMHGFMLLDFFPKPAGF